MASSLYSLTSSVSSVSTTSVVQNPGVDIKVAMVRARVLQTIRNHMPLKALFNPEFKIDLTVFVKDQMLFHKIAEFIAPLVGKDVNVIAQHFEGSELLAELKVLFKEEVYLTAIYEACSDVLNKKAHAKVFKSAIEGRIFTLKNALTAQKKPELIQQSQTQNKISPQNTSAIRQEGAVFIRESLRLHLNALQEPESGSFREHLTKTVEQLLPFIDWITINYVCEFRAEFRGVMENSFTFRNPTGYNYHGNTAALVTEVYLNALGYTTRLMVRGDLEPVITLATAHSLIEVTGPDGLKYIVDPSYIKFHKDVVLNETDLPKTPVLVLEEAEVDTYIEKNIMTHWKANHQRVTDRAVIDKLIQQDQINSHIPEWPEGRFPCGIEEGVRKAFKRVWGLSTYRSASCNAAAHQIFNGCGKAPATYNTIKPMGIFQMTSYLPYAEVEEQLDHLSALKIQNSPEALSLLIQLPRSMQKKYSSLLEGKGGLDTYFRSLRKVINPQGKNLKVVYGCAGSDCTSVLLATDAQELTFVDLTRVSFSEFENALTLLKKSSEAQIRERLGESYFDGRDYYMGGMSFCEEGQHYMEDLPFKFLFDLRETGVDLNQVVLTSIDGGVRIDFTWRYQGADSSRNRSVTLVTADITKPDTYPAHLQSQLKAGIDIFYLKGAFFVPLSYPQFLPHIAKNLNPSGWLMTTDKTSFMEVVNPETCLRQNDLNFSLYQSEEIRLLAELASLPFAPLEPVPVLDTFPKDKRPERCPGTDSTYWLTLNLRQKI